MTTEDRKEIRAQFDDFKKSMEDQFRSFELILREKDKNVELRLGHLEQSIERTHSRGAELHDLSLEHIERHSKTNAEEFNIVHAKLRDHEARVKALEEAPGKEAVEDKKDTKAKVKTAVIGYSVAGVIGGAVGFFTSFFSGGPKP